MITHTNDLYDGWPCKGCEHVARCENPDTAFKSMVQAHHGTSKLETGCRDFINWLRSPIAKEGRV
jgi:hypothetical protein